MKKYFVRYNKRADRLETVVTTGQPPAGANWVEVPFTPSGSLLDSGACGPVSFKCFGYTGYIEFADANYENVFGVWSNDQTFPEEFELAIPRGTFDLFLYGPNTGKEEHFYINGERVATWATGNGERIIYGVDTSVIETMGYCDPNYVEPPPPPPTITFVAYGTRRYNECRSESIPATMPVGTSLNLGVNASDGSDVNTGSTITYISGADGSLVWNGSFWEFQATAGQPTGVGINDTVTLRATHPQNPLVNITETFKLLELYCNPA